MAVMMVSYGRASIAIAAEHVWSSSPPVIFQRPVRGPLWWPTESSHPMPP